MPKTRQVTFTSQRNIVQRSRRLATKKKKMNGKKDCINSTRKDRFNGGSNCLLLFLLYDPIYHLLLVSGSDVHRRAQPV